MNNLESILENKKRDSMQKLYVSARPETWEGTL